MAGQCAGIGAAVVGNGSGVVHAHNVGVEIHQPLASNVGGNSSHAMGGVADRTGESELNDMEIVLREAGVLKNLVYQIMARRAHRVGAGRTGIRIWEKIGDGAAGRGCLAELIVALENVQVE